MHEHSPSSSDVSAADTGALEQQAHTWLRLMKSGSATPRDARQLKAWCATSECHLQAFRKAQRLWDEMLPAAQLVNATDGQLHQYRSMLAAKQSRDTGKRLSRRMFIGGAVAVSGAMASVVMVGPALGLMPSIAELVKSDYRTGVGEQKQLAIARAVSVEMNTRSSLSLLTSDGQTVGVHLLDGEIAVDSGARDKPFVVSALGGTTTGADAHFALRRIGDDVCVTCLKGFVMVSQAGKDIVLHASQQVTYGKNMIDAVKTVVSNDVTAWRTGMLRFQKTALEQVIAEINRYRPGKVVLMAKALQDKPVSGYFNIRDLNRAIAQIQRLFHLEVTTLPGGIVMLR